MILLIDNYDSFSYNLYQYLGTLDDDVKVIRNDALSVEEVAALKPSRIILSPGPGYPKDAGVCVDVARQLAGTVPIMGVCLGHQAICEAFGATIAHAPQLMHGKQSEMRLDTNSALFAHLPNRIKAARYHSLAVVEDTLPECLAVTARAPDGTVMAVEHRELPVYGVQFHPESVMTPDGMQILKNFLSDDLLATKTLIEKPTGESAQADEKAPANSAAVNENAAPIQQKAQKTPHLGLTNPTKLQRKGTLMIQEAIFKLVDKQDLTYDEAYQVISEIMSGDTTPTQTAAFLAALSTKSSKAETIDEIAGCADAMRDKATPVEYNGDLLEIVGTGGDKAKSFNISTTAAFIIAAGGVKVAKHGNRAASSLSGTADCQEALGVNINQDPQKAVELLNNVGMCFFFAQKYHAAMKYVGPIRKELGIRTVFNILGPLTNPAQPNKFILGVYDGALLEVLAKVLVKMGVDNGMVVFGECVLDELSTAGPTDICEIRNGFYKTYTVFPEDFGFASCTREDLEGGTPEENAQITRDILSGKLTGPKRDTVLMNAGAGLYIGGAADSLADGIKVATELVDSGAAEKTMLAYIEESNK